MSQVGPQQSVISQPAMGSQLPAAAASVAGGVHPPTVNPVIPQGPVVQTNLVSGHAIVDDVCKHMFTNPCPYRTKMWCLNVIGW